MSQPRSNLRPDIEGLRAIAVGTVVLYHAHLGLTPGGFVGVDVFFVLSGFLITGILVREVTNTGTIQLRRFWARRARRLLPASATVLVFSAIITWLWLPITQRSVFGGDIVSAALYVVNWRLADRSVDYLAEDVQASPVQHFWSLAVEEQFYVLWPVLILLAALVVMRFRRGKLSRTSMLAIVGAITAASLTWSVIATERTPAQAFFVSTTRIWELGLGAMLAIVAPLVPKLPAALRAAAGWVGLGAIAYAVFVIDESAAWPGVLALIPVLGTALIVASGIERVPGSPYGLFALAPMVWIGGLSYSLYLWHWPVIIAAEGIAGHRLSAHWGLVAAAISLVPAWLCHKYIENPVRFGAQFAPTGRALSLGAALTVCGIVVGLGLGAVNNLTGNQVDEAKRPDTSAPSDNPSTAPIDWSTVDHVDSMVPLPIDAPNDRPALYDSKPECRDTGDATPVICDFGDPKGTHTAFIVGDSKLLQWQPALDRIGKRTGWKIRLLSRSACPFTGSYSTTDSGKADVACHEWGEKALTMIKDAHPDLVILSQRKEVGLSSPDGSKPDAQQMATGMADYYSQLMATGAKVSLILDNPSPTRPPMPVYECVAAHMNQLSSCSFDRETGISLSSAPTQRLAAELAPGVSIVDLTPTICPTARCSAVMGNVLMYRQSSHLTDSFVTTAEPTLSASLYAATGGLFGEPAPSS